MILRDLRIVATHEDACAEVARCVAQTLIHGDRPVLALPTGQTPLPMYEALVFLAREGVVRLSHATVFNLDEYLDLPRTSPHTYRAYMETVLWSRLPHQPLAARIPCSDPDDPTAECRNYEQAIRSAGGIDLAILGIGANGHIGFNEPGTPWHAATHVTQLSETTRRRNADPFGGVHQTPRRAITMGIRTLMHARRIVLLVSGADKAEILASALQGEPTLEIPASVLQLHPALTVVVDRPAGRGLSPDGPCRPEESGAVLIPHPKDPPAEDRPG